MAGTDGTEVAQIERRDLLNFESFRHCEHGGVDSSQWEVGVLSHQLGHSFQISARVSSTSSISRPATDSRDAASIRGPTRVSRK